jgi:hypothetical protein
VKEQSVFGRAAAIAIAAAMLSAGSTFASTVVINSVDTSVPAGGTTLSSDIGGGGVTISGVTYTGANGSAGTFSNGLAAGLGIDSGVILSTGNVQGAVGPNNNSGTSTNWGAPGDAQLTALDIADGGGTSTFDAAVLTFNFTTTASDIFVNYVFASEEYNEFVNQFDDVFAFFVDGTNIATVPSTTTPVSINTINNSVNSSLYKDNSAGGPGGTGGPFDIQYDGLTTVLTAHISGLSAGTHTMKFAIADTNDGNLDSSVFIQAASFSTTQTSVAPLPASFYPGILLIGGLAAYRFTRRVKVV